MLIALKHLGNIEIDADAKKKPESETQNVANKSKLLGLKAFAQQTQLVQKGEDDVLETIQIMCFYRLA